MKKLQLLVLTVSLMGLTSCAHKSAEQKTAKSCCSESKSCDLKKKTACCSDSKSEKKSCSGKSCDMKKKS